MGNLKMSSKGVLFASRFLESMTGANILRSPRTAIIELIANSSDAGATKVEVTWPSDELALFAVEDIAHHVKKTATFDAAPNLKDLSQAGIAEFAGNCWLMGRLTEYTGVVTRYSDATQNLRTTFEKIVIRAGLVSWQKPFQNLRSTRETEMMEIYPAHVVVSWIGHSEKVARKHYLQTTDAHFEKATIPSATQLVASDDAETANFPREKVAIQVANTTCETVQNGMKPKRKKPGKHCTSSISRAFHLPRRDSNPN